MKGKDATVKTKNQPFKEVDKNIDKHIEALKISVYNNHGLTLSALKLQLDIIADLKIMLADGRSWSALPDPKGALDAIADKIKLHISSMKDVELFNSINTKQKEETISDILTDNCTIEYLNSILYAAGVIDENNKNKGCANDYLSGIVKGLIIEGKISKSHYPSIKIVCKHIGREYKRPRAAGKAFTEGLNFITNYLLPQL